METSEARKIPNNDGEIVREIMTDNIINYNIGEIEIRTDKIINNNIGEIEIRMDKIHTEDSSDIVMEAEEAEPE